MKQWTVTYREKSGVKTSVVIEAEDRAGVFAELKQRGINAISITEGVVKAKRRVASGGVSKVFLGAIILVLVAVIGVVVCCMMIGGEKTVDVKKTIKEPVNVASPKIIKTAPKVTNPKDVKEEPVQVVTENPKFGRLPDGRWNLPSRKKIHNVVTNYSNVSREVPFRNATEQIMFQIFSRERGDMPLPLPLISEQERKKLAAILMSKNPISDKDSEEMRLSKEIIEEAKAALRDYLSKGGDVDTFFTFYHNELQRSYEIRKDAVKLIFEAARGEDRSIAAELCEQVNEKLAEQGIKPVKLPRALLEKQ